MGATSIYRNSSTAVLGSLLVLSLCIIGVSLYLTSYYFGAIYPENLQGASLCDVNSFFNCDSTTYSPLSNIMGVPISLLGLSVGVLSLAGFLFGSAKYEGTLYGVLLVNLIGCLLLLIYSLVVLKTLCPFCTLYYVVSGLLFFLFHKTVSSKRTDLKTLSLVALSFLIAYSSSYAFVQSKESTRGKIQESLLSQYTALPDLGAPEQESPYRISFPIEGDSDPPLRIVKFSDFQCPACKALSGHLEKVSHRYRGKIDIQYFFYPLDMACNPSMERALHQNACEASYLAYCLPEHFREIEHLIFANQDSLSSEWIRRVAEERGVLDCLELADTQAAVTEIIQMASPFNVQSTPTMLINGKKIEGVLPLGQLYMILDGILSE